MPNETDPDQWLKRVYEAPSATSLSRTYDAWADSYDADMLRIGYANTAVAAALTARHVADRNSAILEAGVGTGALGEILAILGYRKLAGLDISAGMLAKARARGVYGELRTEQLGERLSFAPETFVAVVCFGVFTTGHAPARAFDELIRITRPGGHLIFTVSTAAWQGAGFETKLHQLEAAERIRPVESTDAYRPMPLSGTEASFTTRGYVYRMR